MAIQKHLRMPRQLLLAANIGSEKLMLGLSMNADALKELRNHPVFVGHAKAETMLRDFDRLRTAIRTHDSDAAETIRLMDALGIGPDRSKDQ